MGALDVGAVAVGALVVGALEVGGLYVGAVYVGALTVCVAPGLDAVPDQDDEVAAGVGFRGAGALDPAGDVDTGLVALVVGVRVARGSRSEDGRGADAALTLVAGVAATDGEGTRDAGVADGDTAATSGSVVSLV